MSYVFQSSNVCLCNPAVIPTPITPVCPEDCNCLLAANLILRATDETAIGPCGKIGIFELDPFNNNTAGCVEALQYSLVQYDSIGFSNVTISSSGTVAFTTADNAVPNEHYQIIYKISCASKGLSSFGCLTIGIKDLCEFVDCQNAVCNPCTGTCESSSIDLDVSITTKYI